MPRNSDHRASINVGLISPECIERVGAFIPMLSSIADEDIARWPKLTKKDGGMLELGLEPVYHSAVTGLIQSFYESHFVQPFDWQPWGSAAEKFVKEPAWCGSDLGKPPYADPKKITDDEFMRFFARTEVRAWHRPALTFL
jgi:hypothetical protein